MQPDKTWSVALYMSVCVAQTRSDLHLESSQKTIQYISYAFQQTTSIPMGTNCALLADLIHHSYVVDCMQWFLKGNEKKPHPLILRSAVWIVSLR
jgi:hypothetical protein